MRRVAGILFVTTILLGSTSASGDERELEFFEKKIRPILTMYCYECHSVESKTVGGELLLDSRDGVKKGGETGGAITPGRPDQSLLIKAIRYTDEHLKMPPKGKLPEAAIADLEAWVLSGAFDPREPTTRAKKSASWDDEMRERAVWWSLLPVSIPAVPAVENADRRITPIDRFISTKLGEQRLQQAESTDPRTFIRRLSLVLTGLPPTIEQVETFVAECGSSAGIPTESRRLTNASCVAIPEDQAATSLETLPAKAVERLVEGMLQSPHFGEHWARHWMDVVRFSETHGNEWNYEVHHAWRYRDYLIRAFNYDVPYDQFVREHIAGDLLVSPRWNEQDQFNESVIGTGFYRFGEVNHDDCISLRSLGYDLADNQIDTLTKAFQATTVACARCHNHKLDPVSMDDYYALLAVLRSSRNVSHCIDARSVNQSQKQRLIELKHTLRQKLAASWRQEGNDFDRYMNAAHASKAKLSIAEELAQGLNPDRLQKWVANLAIEKQSLDEPFEVWRRLVAVDVPQTAETPADVQNVAKSFAQTWESLSTEFTNESAARTESNRTRFEVFADFQHEPLTNWAIGGQGLRQESSLSGDFLVHVDGGLIVQSILPAGRFTHLLSSKLNGTLRSPSIPVGKKYISFQVMGQRSSAVRLVSNNCQLNYANYRALISANLQWVTFSPPEDRESLQTYAELMTMFDNPKFPDQLAPLGGDNTNYKMPWDKAAENPRSYFGVTRVVLHDQPEPPKPELSHLHELFGADQSHQYPDVVLTQSGTNLTIGKIAARYRSRMIAAIDAWSIDRATEDDVRWLDTMVARELIGNNVDQLPQIADLVREYRDVESQLSIPRVIAGLADGGKGIEQPIFARGDCNRPGEKAARHYLKVLSNPTDRTEQFQSFGSGRQELANRIASRENPLTARVMVNRIWHHIFGTGLVRTVDDFGHVGELPSHPELLDYLANRFIEDGWSVKRLIRSIVLSRSFQTSNRPSARSSEVDPQNRLLQHFSARRLEAESIRDVILASSGRLDLTLYGPSIQPFREKEYSDRRLFPGPLDGHGRRSVYIKNNLMESPKFLGTFDFPGGKVTQGRRDVTNVPAQALALLNDPFVLQQAEVWAKRLVANAGDTVDSRIESMFRSSFGRSATPEEQSRFNAAIRDLAKLYNASDGTLLSHEAIWKDIAHAFFNLNEMIYIP